MEMLTVLFLASLACGISSAQIPEAIASPTSKPAQAITSFPTDIPSPTETREPYVYLFEAAPYSIFLDHDSNRGNGAGIKVYMGEQKTFVFEIIGGGSCPSMPSGQGYLVRRPDGKEEWKDRRAMEESELFVANDVTLYAHDWTVYYNCP